MSNIIYYYRDYVIIEVYLGGKKCNWLMRFNPIILGQIASYTMIIIGDDIVRDKDGIIMILKSLWRRIQLIWLVLWIDYLHISTHDNKVNYFVWHLDLYIDYPNWNGSISNRKYVHIYTQVYICNSTRIYIYREMYKINPALIHLYIFSIGKDVCVGHSQERKTFREDE